MGLQLLMYLIIKVYYHQQTSRTWMEISRNQRRKQYVTIAIEKIKLKEERQHHCQWYFVCD